MHSALRILIHPLHYRHDLMISLGRLQHADDRLRALHREYQLQRILAASAATRVPGASTGQPT